MNHTSRNSPKKAQCRSEGGQTAIHMDPQMGSIPFMTTGDKIMTLLNISEWKLPHSHLDLEEYSYYADQQRGQIGGPSHGSRVHWQTEANGFPYYDRNEPPPRNWQYQNRWEEQRTYKQLLGCHPCYPQRINQNINQREYYHSLSNSQNHYQPRGPHQLYKGCPPFD